MNKNIFLSFLMLLLFSGLFSAFAAETEKPTLLEFKFSKGETSRILSTVNEDVFINGKLSHRAKILNRIFCKTISVDNNGSGKTEATFMTSETAVGAKDSNFSWGNEYKSVFTRDKRGRYSIDDIYFMPTVRDVPVFPDHPVKKGDTWISEGHEAHDLRVSFKMKEPFKVPFTANYKYVDDVRDSKTGKTFNLIEVKYNMYFESPRQDSVKADMRNLPAVTMGHSQQKIWWDNEKGVIDHYSEDFRIMIETFNGDQLTFKGTAHAEGVEIQQVDTDENLEKIKDSVSKLGYDNVAVTKGEKGVTISIENIQFEADSAILTQSEKKKLQKISEILKTFSNDLLITGHCADRGTKQNQQRISEERAASVADYLSSLKVRSPECIFTQGKGATVPIAPNTTEQGRAKNRRVEITIMEE